LGHSVQTRIGQYVCSVSATARDKSAYTLPGAFITVSVKKCVTEVVSKDCRKQQVWRPLQTLFMTSPTDMT